MLTLPASAMLSFMSIVSLPANFINDIKTSAGDIFEDLAPIIAIVVGISLGVWVIKLAIGFFSHKGKTK